MKKAIVIGAGVGGLSIAARLLKCGFKVEIYEKNSKVGGVTNSLSIDNFKFDLTASLLMMPKDYIEIFQYCNKNYKDYFSLIPINPLYKVFYTDNTYYNFSNYLPSLCKTIRKITNNDYKNISGFFEFLSYNYGKYQLAENYFLNKSFLEIKDFFTPKKLFKAFKLHTFSSCYSNCHKYITNTKLLNFLMFQAMYVGISPYESPNIYNLISASTQYEGLYYIEGGMYAYVKALEKLVLDLGGIIHTSSKVDDILFKNRTAIGIKTNNVNVYSDLVVCSSDYSYSIKTFIENKNLRPLLHSVDDFKYSCSTFILYLALNKKYSTLNIHNIFINKDFKKNIEAPFKGKLSKNPSMYIYCPSSIDKTICPPNCEVMNIMIRVPNLTSKSVIWNKNTVNRIENYLINTLSKINGLEDIKYHIVFKHHLSPVDLKKDFNNYAGCAFGISHMLSQSLIFRPQCKIASIDNLYFTGSSIHPGTGISMVLKSSKICEHTIIKNI